MKKYPYILALLLCAFFISHGQDTIQPLSFSEVVKVDSNLSKRELFKRAKAWLIAITTADISRTLQSEDPVAGQLIAKAYYTRKTNPYWGSWVTGTAEVTFVLTITVKDGRYKYEFTDFIEVIPSSSYYTLGNLTTSPVYCDKCQLKKWFDEDWLDAKQKAKQYAHQGAASLYKAMSKPLEEDW